MDVTIIDDDYIIAELIKKAYPHIGLTHKEMTVLFYDLWWYEETWVFSDLLKILENCELYRCVIEDKLIFSDFIKKYENELPHYSDETPLERYATENYTIPEEVTEEEYVIAIVDSINEDGTDRHAIYNDDFVIVYEF